MNAIIPASSIPPSPVNEFNTECGFFMAAVSAFLKSDVEPADIAMEIQGIINVTRQLAILSGVVLDA